MVPTIYFAVLFLSFFLFSLLYDVKKCGEGSENTFIFILMGAIYSVLWPIMIPCTVFAVLLYTTFKISNYLKGLIKGVNSKKLITKKKRPPIQATPRSNWERISRIVLKNFNAIHTKGITQFTYYATHDRIALDFIDAISSGELPRSINFNYFTCELIDSLINRVYVKCDLHLLNIDQSHFRAEVHRQLAVLRKEVI